MTIKQRLLKMIYPFIMWLTGFKKTSDKIKINTAVKQPVTSLYNMHATLINEDTLSMDSLKGKKIMLVNTASDCGFTNQYDDLEKLFKKYKGKLVILGFPANDFKDQETGTDADIAKFCKINFGVTFPLMKKSSVIKGIKQNEIFNWLSDSAKNGWNNQAPVWNFSKYLVNEQGILTHYFDPSVSPLSIEISESID